MRQNLINSARPEHDLRKVVTGNMVVSNGFCGVKVVKYRLQFSLGSPSGT